MRTESTGFFLRLYVTRIMSIPSSQLGSSSELNVATCLEQKGSGGGGGGLKGSPLRLLVSAKNAQCTCLHLLVLWSHGITSGNTNRFMYGHSWENVRCCITIIVHCTARHFSCCKAAEFKRMRETNMNTENYAKGNAETLFKLFTKWDRRERHGNRYTRMIYFLPASLYLIRS